MTGIKVGDRVRVSYEGDVVRDADEGVLVVSASADGITDYWCTVPDDAVVEIIVPPLAIGDTLTNKSPEPPIGTCVLNAESQIVAARKGDGDWAIAGGDSSCPWRPFISAWSGCTVVHVGTGRRW